LVFAQEPPFPYPFFPPLLLRDGAVLGADLFHLPPRPQSFSSSLLVSFPAASQSRMPSPIVLVPKHNRALIHIRLRPFSVVFFLLVSSEWFPLCVPHSRGPRRIVYFFFFVLPSVHPAWARPSFYEYFRLLSRKVPIFSSTVHVFVFSVFRTLPQSSPFFFRGSEPATAFAHPVLPFCFPPKYSSRVRPKTLATFSQRLRRALGTLIFTCEILPLFRLSILRPPPFIYDHVPSNGECLTRLPLPRSGLTHPPFFGPDDTSFQPFPRESGMKLFRAVQDALFPWISSELRPRPCSHPGRRAPCPLLPAPSLRFSCSAIPTL